MSYVDQENRYTRDFLSNFRSLQKDLITELHEDMSIVEESFVAPEGESARPKDIDECHQEGDWVYFSRRGIYYRRPSGAPTNDRWHTDSQTQLLLDPSRIDGEIHAMSISRDHSTLAYLVKRIGEEEGVIHFKDLSCARGWLDDFQIYGAFNFLWMGDSRSVIYTSLNSKLRPDRVIIRNLVEQQTAYADINEVFRDKDERFFVDIALTKDRQFVTITSSSRTTTEVHVLPVSPETSESQVPILVRPREQNVEYFLDHHSKSDRFTIVSNAGQDRRFKVLTAPSDAPSQWETLLTLEEDTFLEDVDLFETHLAIYARRNGLPAVLAFEFGRKRLHKIELPEQISTVVPGINANWSASGFEFICIHAVVRECVYRYDFGTQSLHLNKRVAIASVKEGELSVVRCSVPPSEDGFSPVLTIVHDKKASKSVDGREKYLLINYNTYGIDTSLPFDPTFLPLIRRGWKIASLHARGGNAFGPECYRSGRELQKPNCLKDVSNALKFLKGAGHKNVVVGLGTSAGACMLGASLCHQLTDNTQPQWDGMVLHVPFLDPLTAMMDSDLPLTATEIDEWGDPSVSDQVRKCMESYSPVHNVPQNSQVAKHPWIMLTAGLKDRRVPFWHPLKFIATLRNRTRAYSKNGAPLIMQTRKDQGHFGDTTDASVDDIAEWLSFVISIPAQG